jgi:hypothetical protein
MTERLVKSKTNGCESRDDHLQWPSESFKVMSISGGKVVGRRRGRVQGDAHPGRAGGAGSDLSSRDTAAGAWSP